MGARGFPARADSVNRSPTVALRVIEGREIVAPKAPAGLTARGKRRWRQLWASGVAKAWDPVADLGVLTRLALATDELEQVEAVLKKTWLISAPGGEPKLNPLAPYVANLKGEIARAETDLGLTPMARARLGLVIGEAKLTAQELNRRLEKRGHAAATEAVATWEAEWQEV